MIYQMAVIEEVYLTHDNGGIDYRVHVSSENHVKVYISENGIWREHFNRELAKNPERMDIALTEEGKPKWSIHPILELMPRKVFVGKSPLNAMTEYSGSYGQEYDGNSILLECDTGYIFIGDTISKFQCDADIIEFVSPIGNSDVPYPYAIDENRNYYLFLPGVYFHESILADLKEDPYDVYYDILGDEHRAVKKYPADLDIKNIQYITDLTLVKSVN